MVYAHTYRYAREPDKSSHQPLKRLWCDEKRNHGIGNGGKMTQTCDNMYGLDPEKKTFRPHGSMAFSLAPLRPRFGAPRIAAPSSTCNGARHAV
jgi:hypothetical protein